MHVLLSRGECREQFLVASESVIIRNILGFGFSGSKTFCGVSIHFPFWIYKPTGPGFGFELCLLHDASHETAVLSVLLVSVETRASLCSFLEDNLSK